MTVKELAEALDFTVYTTLCTADVDGVYCCDLLSNSLVKLSKGCAWLTVMNNVNVAAVGYARNPSCIILTEGVTPDDEMLKKALEHGISVLGTKLKTYEAAMLIGLRINKLESDNI